MQGLWNWRIISLIEQDSHRITRNLRANRGRSWELGMYTKLHSHAEQIQDNVRFLVDDTTSPMNDAQLKYLDRILRNTIEFQDVYTRLSNMPIGDVLSILNHDIRNLITPVIGYAELLDMRMVGPLSDVQGQHVKAICQEAGRLRDELDTILETTREQRADSSDSLAG